MNFYIVLAISVFAGGSKASGCPIELTAKEPKYGSEGKFGEVHVLTFSKTSGYTSCLWRFSSAKNNLLNLLFINITAQSTSSGSGCNGNYALIKTHDAETLSSTTFEPYCGERSLPGIRINGTVEIELHDHGHMPGGRGISLAVFVESSSKDCGGIYNDSSYGVPVSYDSSLVPSNEVTHCVWFFEFHQARSLSVVASYFGLEQDLVTRVPECSTNKQYLSMRSWNRTNWDSYQETRECKAQSQQTPIFNLPKVDRFAVTIHSERWFSSKKLYAVCFPSTEGISDSKLAIHGKGNKTYQDVQFDDAKLVEALLVLKPKEIADQLFFVMERGRQLCNRGTLEIWSEHAKIFHRNSSLCSNPNNDLKTAFNFQDTALLYFKSTVSQLKELKIWFYSSNKGCGGLFQFLPGHSIIVKSPNYGIGDYPANSDCRWVFLADSNTRISIAIKTIDLETCCDYIDIYRGFRKQYGKLYHVIGWRKKQYIVTGDMEMYFKSDQGYEYAGFMINVTEACGGTYSLSSGNSRTIASPGFGTGNYPAYSDCQWNFLASSSTILVIAINEIKLQYRDTTCRFDYIEIYKGVYSAKVRQHKLCSAPNMYLQNGNATITFQSNGYSQGTGFRIDVVAVKDHKYKSCTEALYAIGNTGGRYLLQIDSETVFVHCELQGNSIKTMITHRDGDRQFHVSGYSWGGSFKKNLAYMQNMTGIAKIIDRSDICMQAVNVTCHYSRITSFSWLTNRNNQIMMYWAGGPSNGTGCACGRTRSCALKSGKCNCDKNDKVLRYDMGLVTRKSDLPLTSIHTGDTSGDYAYKDITVGNVVCFKAIPQTTTSATTTQKTTTVKTTSTSTSKIDTKTDPNTTIKDSTSKEYPASLTTPTNKATKSGHSKYATATTKITIIGKKGQSSSGNITVYAISSVSGIVAVIFIVALTIIIRRRKASSTAKDSIETSSRKERPRQNSAMPLVEMTERPKPFVPDTSVTYSVPDNCHQETEATEWNNPYYESNDMAPPTMEAENPYYGGSLGMTVENPYYQSSDMQTEAEYETTDPDEHLYAAPDANPSKPVYSYATTEELKTGQTGNCQENFYEYADTEQAL